MTRVIATLEFHLGNMHTFEEHCHFEIQDDSKDNNGVGKENNGVGKENNGCSKKTMGWTKRTMG